jgi:hypothetical protein
MALFIETGKLTFSSTDTGTITFSESYATVPKVVAMAAGDVNVYVESVSTSTSVIRTSAIFSGDIHYHVINNE